MSNVCQLVVVIFLIVVFQIRSVDDSNDGNEDVDIDEVCIYLVCQCASVCLVCQGLLDEGDNSMDEEETGSKVSVSIMCGVYYLVQDGAMQDGLQKEQDHAKYQPFSGELRS